MTQVALASQPQPDLRTDAVGTIVENPAAGEIARHPALSPAALVRKGSPLDVPANCLAIECGEWAVAFHPAADPTSRTSALHTALLRARLHEALAARGGLVVLAADAPLAPGDVENLILTHTNALERAYAAWADRREVNVVLTWNTSAVLDRFADSPELSSLARRPHLAADQVAAAVQHLANRLSDAAFDQLAATFPTPIRHPTPPGTLLHAAILVEDGHEQVLEAVLNQIDSVWPEGFRLRVVGPSPAASFATLTLEAVSLGDVAEARRLFHPDEPAPATLDQIEQTRRRILRQGSCPHGPEVLSRLARIAQARSEMQSDMAGVGHLTTRTQPLRFLISMRRSDQIGVRQTRQGIFP